MKVQNILTPLWFALKIKFVLKIRKQCVGNLTDFLNHKTNKESLMTVLCSVVKHLGHLGSGQSTQEEGRNTRLRLLFSPAYTSFVLQPLLDCFKTEQSTVKASLAVNYNYNFSSFQLKTDSNTTIAPKTASCPAIRFLVLLDTACIFQLFIASITQTAHSGPS